MPLTLYYYTGWDHCQLHGCPKGESIWRDFPFKDVPGKPSVKQLQIEADGIEFVICDLKKQSWDNPPDWYGKKNYLIAESGEYSLRHGHLRRIRESKVMVVTDLDHTLVGHERDPENKLLEEFRNLWLGEYALNGSALAYSTGRSKSMALDVAQERQLIRPDLLICGVGTEVYTVPSRLPILGWWEDRDSLELMPEWKSKMLNGFNRATVEELLTSRFQKFELRGTPVDDPYRIPTAYQMDEAFDDSKKLLQEALGSSYQVISSGHGEWKLIDICSAEAGKLKAMQFAMSTLKFEPAKTLACGDSGNDELMFRNSGGHGVMVANALPELVEAMTAAADPPAKELRRGEEFKTCHGSTMLFAGREVAGGIVEALQYFFPR